MHKPLELMNAQGRFTAHPVSLMTKVIKYKHIPSLKSMYFFQVFWGDQLGNSLQSFLVDRESGEN